MATVAKPTAPTRQIGTPPMVPRIAPREDLNPFRIAQIQFDMAAEFLKLDPGLAPDSSHAQARSGSFHSHQNGQWPGESSHRLSRPAQCGTRTC